MSGATALEALEAGEAAIVATDTVYGLAALPGSAGYGRILSLKERPEDQVLPWLVAGVSALDVLARDVPVYARRLAGMFWPGALTLVVRASSAARAYGCTARDGTVALRSPDEPQLLAMLERLASPLACTSANKHGAPAPTAIGEIPAEMLGLPGADELAPVCGAGRASTIVECTGPVPKVLRQGPIPGRVILDVAFYGATLS